MIIDFHVHTFPEKISKKTAVHLAHIGHILPRTDASIPGLLVSMKEAGVDYSVNLPVMTRPEQVEKINSSMIRDRDSLFEKGVITFGGMHPDFTNYKKELARLKSAGIPGIKLHPAYQNVDLDDIRMMRIIDAASDLGLIVLIHAGIDIGIYDHNYASVAHILKILREVGPQKFVLAHMGNWGCWDAVESDLCGAPLWFDTAFSCGPIIKYPDCGEEPYLPYNLHDEDFVRIVKKHGTDRILFATDSPWGDQKEYVERISRMDFTAGQKEQIFAKNAASLLGIL